MNNEYQAQKIESYAFAFLLMFKLVYMRKYINSAYEAQKKREFANILIVHTKPKKKREFKLVDMRK